MNIIKQVNKAVNHKLLGAVTIVEEVYSRFELDTEPVLIGYRVKRADGKVVDVVELNLIEKLK